MIRQTNTALTRRVELIEERLITKRSPIEMVMCDDPWFHDIAVRYGLNLEELMHGGSILAALPSVVLRQMLEELDEDSAAA